MLGVEMPSIDFWTVLRSVVPDGAPLPEKVSGTRDWTFITMKLFCTLSHLANGKWLAGHIGSSTGQVEVTVR
jgi:hypothetical protein